MDETRTWSFREKEGKKSRGGKDFIGTFFVLRPSLVSGFYPDGLQIIIMLSLAVEAELREDALDCLCCSSVY